jgi:acetoin utilization deacetylase AcuC-like enzyme
MRGKVSNQLLPQLKTFAPDILFISAGFDAHFDDLYHFLNENDFHWLTSELCNIVDKNGGKVISVCLFILDYI